MRQSNQIKLLVAGLTLLTLGCSDKPAEKYQEPQAAPPSIRCETLRSWTIPNGGSGRVLLISRENLTDSTLIALGRQLKADGATYNRYFVYVFTDKEAATTLRDNMMNLNEADYRRFCQNNVAVYTKNVNSSLNEFGYSLGGMCADDKDQASRWKKIKY